MNRDLSAAGRITKPYGLEGGAYAVLYDNFPAKPNIEEPLVVFIDALAVPLFLEHFERRGQKGSLMRFADIDTEDRLRELIGLEFYTVPADLLGEIRKNPCQASMILNSRGDGGRETTVTADDEGLDPAELVGFKAILIQTCGDDAQDEEQISTLKDSHTPNALISEGTVTGYVESELNPLFEIETEGREVLVPVSDDFISGIDVANRTIEFSLPEGLLELYM